MIPAYMARMQVSLDTIESGTQAWLLQPESGRRMTREEYRSFVDANPELRVEMTAQGEVIVMPPAHTRTGYQNGEIFRQVSNWALADGRGVAFDSSTGYDLPNGANRAPDVSWVLKSRIAELTPEERFDYYPLCPDFVIELRSKSDRLSTLQAKMREYLANGARLGWLVDPLERSVHVYRAGALPQVLTEPAAITGDPELPGLIVDLTTIWKPKF